MGTPQILIAEDNEINLFVLEAMLRADGHAPLVARNGLEAVEIALRERPRVILMDVAMPRMDGLNAAREIRRELTPEECSIVAVTAHVTPHHKQDCREAGCDAFVGKPFDFAVVRGIVERALDGTRAPCDADGAEAAVQGLRPRPVSRAG